MVRYQFSCLVFCLFSNTCTRNMKNSFLPQSRFLLLFLTKGRRLKHIQRHSCGENVSESVVYVHFLVVALRSPWKKKFAFDRAFKSSLCFCSTRHWRPFSCFFVCLFCILSLFCCCCCCCCFVAFVFVLFLSYVVMMVHSAFLISSAPPGCVFQGKWFPEGHQFRPDPCTFCRCSNGMSMCLAADCVPPSCVDFVQDPNQCCASCPNGRQLVLLFLPALILSGNQGSEAAGLSFFLS